jgi:hypothetical protein
MMPRYYFSITGGFEFDAKDSEVLPNDLAAHNRAKLCFGME